MGVNQLIVLVYVNRKTDIKTYKNLMYYTPKGINNNYNIIINVSNFCSQPIDSNIKRCEETSKLTTAQVEDYTIGCLLDYECIKNHYKLIAVDSRRQRC